jgi:sec-independent protein translocase protein TatA
MPIGVPELLIVLVVLLLIFGPKRLPGLGKQLGGGLREFKDSVTGKAGDDEDDPPAALPAPDSASGTTAPRSEGERSAEPPRP